MNIYPNASAANFCSWLLSNSGNTITAPRKVQVNQIISAFNSNSYVTLSVYNQYVQYTNQFYSQYLQYQAQQPNLPINASLDSLTTLWLSYVSSPSLATVYAVDAFFKQLRADGNLLFDYIFLFAQDVQANANISLINPNLYSVTTHNSPTFLANAGYTGNGTTAYLSSNFIASSNASQYTLNYNCWGVYTRNVIAVTGQSEMGAYDGTHRLILQTRLNATTLGMYNDNNAQSTFSSTATQGLFSINRTASNAVAPWRNGVSYGASTAAPVALTSTADYFLAYNNNGTPSSYSTNQIALAFRGNGAINQVTFNSAVNLLMTNLGAHY